jgi:hypothetical protein
MMNKWILMLLSLFLFLLSCKKENKIFKSQSLIEFSQNEASKVIPFSASADFLLPIKVQINSTPFTFDKTIQIIECDSNNTAIKSKHYVIKNYKVVLHKDSVFAVFTVLIKSSNFSDGENVSVSFKISDSSQVKPANNYNKFTLTISKQSFLDVFVGSYLCSEPINQDSYKTVFIAGLQPNTIKDLNFWNFPANGQTLVYTFSKDSTMKVEILEQSWVDKEGQDYVISGKGTYDFLGNITINYRVLKKSVLYEEGIHTFTPLK